MSEINKSLFLRQYQDTRNMLAVILNDLANAASLRPDLQELQVWSQEEGDESPGKGTFVTRNLTDVLRQRSKRIASRSYFRLAVVGEFSRGKSTLINALLGREILTSDFRPNTAALTLLRYSEKEKVRVVFVDELNKKPLEWSPTDLKEELKQFTSDAAVTSDYKALLDGREKSLSEQIAQVEVYSNVEFLKSREIEIVDTPGLGSIFPAHKKVTRSVVPEVDATLFLVQADPGLGESEILFLKFVREYVDQIFFVLTKSDMSRSKSELQQMLDFVKKTIEIQVGINVKNLFSVSALKQLEGKNKESGFIDFLPALENFLVTSTGIARVQIPFDLARTQWLRLFDSVERDYLAVDRELSDLKGELNSLLRDEKNIIEMRDSLLKQIDLEIENLIKGTLSGIEFLKINLQKEVEDAIDKFDWEQVRKADVYIEPVIKDFIVSWLRRKEENFKSTCEDLQKNVETELKKILTSLDMKDQIQDKNLAWTIFSPKSKGSFSGDVIKLFGTSVFAGLVAYLIGVGIADVIITITGVLSGGIGLIPILAGLGGLAAPAFGFKDQIKKRIKLNLASPMPGATTNVYAAIIDGYETDGKHVEGIKEKVDDSFRFWGSEIKNNVTDIVNTNLNSRLASLKRQIDEKEKGKTNRESEHKKYLLEIEAFVSMAQRMDKVADAIKDLSNDKNIEMPKLMPVVEKSHIYKFLIK